jgi:hypothetical protein
MLQITDNLAGIKTTVGRQTRRQRPRKRQSPRRHFRSGHRAAVWRALTGAALYLDKDVPTLAVAAESCGSNIQYVRAAVALLRAGDPLLDLALAGSISLLVAANQVRRRQKMESVTVDAAVASWCKWTAEQRAEFGRGAGVGNLWDDAIIPTIAEERASQIQAAE